MHTKARKVMIIGAGNVGASAAYALLNQSICEELILVDLNQQRTGLPLDREAMADKVRKLGFEIYAGKGCTEYGVAGTIAEICRNIFTGSHRALAVSCILDGEYGVSGAAAGVPAVLAQGGVKQIIELQLAGEEQAKFSQSIAVIKANIARLP